MKIFSSLLVAVDRRGSYDSLGVVFIFFHKTCDSILEASLQDSYNERSQMRGHNMFSFISDKSVVKKSWNYLQNSILSGFFFTIFADFKNNFPNLQH